jgi:hypothetical protein
MSSSGRESIGSSQVDTHGSEKDEMDPTPVGLSTDLEKAAMPAPKRVSATDWTGPDDKENPQNWPKLIRHYHILPPALISFAA